MSRVEELQALAESEGLTLPYAPETICNLEDTGAVVDLQTGAILIGEVDQPYSWELTAKGEQVVDRLGS